VKNKVVEIIIPAALAMVFSSQKAVAADVDSCPFEL